MTRATSRICEWFARTRVVRKRAILILETCVILAILVASANGQSSRQRTPAPTISPAAKDYQTRWMQYFKSRTSPPPPSTHSGVKLRQTSSNDGVVVNGFECQRTQTLFANPDNPHMYHLCVRSRDNWYVYHLSCPQGSVFDESYRKCAQSRRKSGGGVVPTATSPLAFTSPTVAYKRPVPVTTQVTRRPFTRHTTTTRSPEANLWSMMMWFATATPSMPTVTTAPTTTTERITTTTTAPEPQPEPDVSSLDFGSSSEEESTERTMSIKNVALPGNMHMYLFSDKSEEAITEKDISNESNILDESIVDTNTLSVHQYQPPPPQPKQRKPLSSKSKSKKKGREEESEEDSSAGGRRPRLLQWLDRL